MQYLISLTRLIDAFTEHTGRFISWLNIGMVVGTVLVVVLRYVFNNSSIALQEGVIYLHGAVFLLGSAYTLKHNEHVRVDILYQRFSPRGRAVVNLLGTLLLLLPSLIYICIESWPYILQSWKFKEVSQEAAGLPYVYLLKTLILGMVVVLGLQGIAEAMRSLVTIINPNMESNNG
ncbi:C4-dicarboxylate ABC transporter permease [Hahella sp. CCB-MM4]|uniref:TRAP transporter small permease subunit n=1 Tax=Hahella sp. (strain CCB-MM4) TaxID=1926491 RepID=UPI000B9AE498|nr:TRAP transporter small permease subunit [Hahella sp. CCB-MM4]OZG75081.1 C4-dicarboxylate ABC transporter permease [Hahella sp. CCB-MM4]